MLKIYLYILFVTFHSHVRAITDLTHICDNVAANDIVAHPFDCQAYFQCAKTPQVHYCDIGRHFDATHKLCDLPEAANCRLANEMTEQVVSPFIALDADTGKATLPLHKFNPKHVECVHYGAYHLPHPQLCNHYYICAYGHLHKHSCGRGTLWHYEHEQCESVAEQDVTCFPGARRVVSDQHAPFADGHSTTAVYEATVCYPLYTTAWPSTDSTATRNPTGTTPNFASTSSSSSIDQSHADTSTTTTWYLTGSTPNFSEMEKSSTATTNGATKVTTTTTPTWYLTGSTPNFSEMEKSSTATTKGATKVTTTTTPTWHSTGSTPNFGKVDNIKASSGHATPNSPTYPTPPTPPIVLSKPSTTVQPVATTKRAIANCPDSNHAYLPHPNNCSKYFICILGKAVLTSCPQGLYWDHKAESCDLAENVKCVNA